ncbi:hypothetical protein ACCO45_011132 [Purpureocillium lilacinum]|uniref:Uncharacterized protein n=1 Tax=Purpureocillium lilacinum TaxID=33203 RepID=A0ACC4DI87_PURLI
MYVGGHNTFIVSWASHALQVPPSSPGSGPPLQPKLMDCAEATSAGKWPKQPLLGRPFSVSLARSNWPPPRQGARVAPRLPAPLRVAWIPLMLDLPFPARRRPLIIVGPPFHPLLVLLLFPLVRLCSALAPGHITRMCHKAPVEAYHQAPLVRPIVRRDMGSDARRHIAPRSPPSRPTRRDAGQS